MILAQKQRSMEEGSPKIKPMHSWSVHVQQRRQRIYNAKKTVCSISGARKTGQLHVKEHYIQKLKMDERPKVRLDTIKLPEKNTCRRLLDINHSNILLDSSPKGN